MTKFIFFSFLVIFAVSTSALDTPDFLQICKRNDPNLNECVKNSVTLLKPYLATGVPEYNLPNLEPLLLKELRITEGKNGLRIMANDVKAYGSSDYVVEDLKIDMANIVFDLDIRLRHLYVNGQYEIDGKILMLPLTGQGTVIGNFTDCTGKVVFRCEPIPDGSGVEFLKIQDFDLKITVGKGTVEFQNLFGGDKVVGDVINTAINSNFDAVLRELKPLIEKALGDVFREIGDSVFATFTYEQLFPSS